VRLVGAGAQGGEGRVSYRPPVGAEVGDPFRPPAHPYGPGNRGLEYDTAPGDPVYASADGTVTFAGQVAGSLHVTVGHADGVRTTYAFLDRVEVARGQRVTQGDVVGAAGERLHFSARVGDAYVDPAALFDPGATVVELLPFEVPPGSDPEHEAARDAADQVRRHRTPGVPNVELGLPDAYEWLRDRAEGVARSWDDVNPAGRLLDMSMDLGERLLFPGPCSDGPPPTRPVAGADRVAITVDGLASASASGTMRTLRTAELGYDDDRVVRFSYAGGAVPGTGDALGLDGAPYEAADSQRDLHEAAGELADLVEGVLAAEPGATVDLLGHSQGGLVARLAVAELQRRGVGLDRLGLLATLGTPHRGADLASAAQLVDTRPTGSVALDVGEAIVGAGGGRRLDTDSAAVRQLAEGSDVVRELDRAGVPDGVAVVSIAARGDAVVASPQSHVDGATNVTVPVDGWHAHSDLVASDAATSELARALAGRPPGCETAGDVVADVAVGHGVSFAEDAAGYALYTLAR
jgi:thioesterase domain-containing protein